MWETIHATRSRSLTILIENLYQAYDNTNLLAKLTLLVCLVNETENRVTLKTRDYSSSYDKIKVFHSIGTQF